MISWNLPLMIRDSPIQAEVFPVRKSKPCYGIRIPARKSLISYIPGFPAGDRDHTSTFLTVYIPAKVATHPYHIHSWVYSSII
jgi:hypothetical protein